MKKIIVLVLFAAMCAIPLRAQKLKNEGLVLTGSLVEVRPNGTDRDDGVLFQLKLYMQLRNDSTRTLISLRPSRDDVTLEFLDSFAPSDDGLSNVLRLAPFKYPCSFEPCDERRYNGPARQTEIPEEPGGGYVVLAPGKYYEYVELIRIKGAYDLPMKPGESYIDVRDNTPESKFPALRVTYHVPAEKYPGKTSLFLTLQEKWKKLGHLVLDSNGDFTLRSDTILNRQGS